MKKIKIFMSTSLLFLFLIAFFFFGKTTTILAIESNVGDEYYESVRGLKGEELKRGLYEIIKGHKMFSYGSSMNEIMKDTDEDPYNPNNMIFVYTGSTSKSTSFNKEHVWAKSRGNFGSGLGPNSDLHHLRPCYSNLNSARSNYYFAEGGDEISNYPGNYKTSNTFEPSDAFKGDVARMVFYMATRYEGTETVNGSTYSWPDLELTETIKGDSDKTPTMGKLSDLYKWNLEDEVSAYEINRNNIIYSDYQKNRNPYIDHPEFIVMIYDETYNGAGALNDLNGNGGGDIVEKTHEEAIAEIEKIGVVTMESNFQITKAENLYNSLSQTEKELVTNYDELKAKRKIFDTMSLYSNVVGGDEVFKGNLLNRSGASSNSYQSDVSFKMNNQSFYANVCLGNSTEFRLGANASNASGLELEQKFVKDGKTSGALLEMQFDVAEANKVEVVDSGTKWGTITGWSILYSLDQGATYEVLGSGTTIEEMVATTTSTLRNVRFAFILYGETPRLGLLEFNIYKLSSDIESKEELIFNDMLDDIIEVTSDSNSDILALELYYDSLSTENKAKMNYDLVKQYRDEYKNLTGDEVSVVDLNNKLNSLNTLLNTAITVDNLNNLMNSINSAITAKNTYLNKGGLEEKIVNGEAITNAYTAIEGFFQNELVKVLEYKNNMDEITNDNYKGIIAKLNELNSAISNYETKFEKTVVNKNLISELITSINEKFQATIDKINTVKTMISDLKMYVYNNGVNQDSKDALNKLIADIEEYMAVNTINEEEVEYSYIVELKDRISKIGTTGGCKNSVTTILIVNVGMVGFLFLKRKEN